ncbi:MAG: Acetoin:2,6-dichlorophenolindophenol oxidoreductase subunit alpha [candidate division TA06 bacterium ADurb.Bin417]|uniref:Acetoin:2,6-dichlorophenolindophenol oxidoreductase subunit alpha n=1 Tax=candidate division TA06 bacterium ADurb.Bin417 TaxID=1852828 RepID=A0A1V5MEF5_UNCT6|nr:MAG: Acetoin:2,6-dichlorophenolindophenol oxidoreductase subunit alpha [candidate division TA06 bacterium ADurb.Bin417]
MPAECLDGMDVLAVREAVARRVAAARKGGGPAFLVANTYRYYGHSRSDPRVYRTREEEKNWKDRDCIEQFAARLVKAGILTQAEVDECDRETAAAIAAAVEFAIQSPDPAPEELYRDVYYEAEEGSIYA